MLVPQKTALFFPINIFIWFTMNSRETEVEIVHKKITSEGPFFFQNNHFITMTFELELN